MSGEILATSMATVVNTDASLSELEHALIVIDTALSTRTDVYRGEDLTDLQYARKHVRMAREAVLTILLRCVRA